MWSKDSYKNKINTQEILYSSCDELDSVVRVLSKCPGIVDQKDILLLNKEMAKVNANDKFLLQIGDCAELFEDSTIQYLNLQLKLYNDVSKLIEDSLKKTVCCIGRIAGQYGKPRSNKIEKRGIKELINYYGDIVNSYKYTVKDRMPDPNRMMLAYLYSKKTYDYISQVEQNYKRKFYISHEAFLLPYEEIFTRKYYNKWYNVSCHLPWIGMRTAFTESAHIEYIRGIQNPIAIKLGPNISENKILQIVTTLNPFNIPGRLIFVYRFGLEFIDQKLCYLLEVINRKKLNVILCCDPMHGNIKQNDNGIKVREVDDILQELKIAINLHQKYNINLGGIHLEATGDDIYECLDKKMPINPNKYKTKVDPRLNYIQTLEILHKAFV
jgi:3-deoxy-7-phosphoheptulonate synthase